AFVDPRQARALDRADVDERVVLSIVARDEAEAFHRVEELDRSGGLFAGQLALRTRALLLDRNHVADDLEIRRGDLAAPVDQVEGEFLPFGQAFEARPLDLADVDEHVLAAFVALDEAEALLRIEELDLALSGADDLRRHAASPGSPRSTTATEPTATAAEATVAVSASEAISTAEAVAT